MTDPKPAPVCARCDDTHTVHLEDRSQMCTACPVPCSECRQGGNGPYCATTPCACACHTKAAPAARTLRCLRCGAVEQRTTDVVCWPCSDQHDAVPTRMVIEPTEEQKQAAAAFGQHTPEDEEALARLLATRDARSRASRDKELADWNEVCARLIDRAASGFTEHAHGDDVLRPAIQKVIDLRMGVWGAQYANVTKLRADLEAARAEVARVQAAHDADSLVALEAAAHSRAGIAELEGRTAELLQQHYLDLRLRKKDAERIAELEEALGRDAIGSASQLLEWAADRMVNVYGVHAGTDFVLSIRGRAALCRSAQRPQAPQAEDSPAQTLEARVAELERTEAKLTNACKMSLATSGRRLEYIKALHAAIDAYVEDEDEDRVVTFDALRDVRARGAHLDALAVAQPSLDDVKALMAAGAELCSRLQADLDDECEPTRVDPATLAALKAMREVAQRLAPKAPQVHPFIARQPGQSPVECSKCRKPSVLVDGEYRCPNNPECGV